MDGISSWIGCTPPQYIFSRRRFVGIALQPPETTPGSWIGAGKSTIDDATGDILLTARPRVVAGNVRGCAANIYRSQDGVDFHQVGGISKEEAARISGISLFSIEGTQLLRDPATGLWHLYLSIDTSETFIWGGLQWQTLLLVSTSLEGPWESKGIVLRNDQEYDGYQARDSSIDIVDGLWVCVYKAMNDKREVRPALALSNDGIHWRKQGTLSIDGRDTMCFLSGSFLPGALGPLFVGLESSLNDSRVKAADVTYADEHGIGHGNTDTYCVAYLLDRPGMNLEPIYRSLWEARSDFEHPKYPLLGYSSILFDASHSRYLIYVEAIDPSLQKPIGLNETVERLLVFEATVSSRKD